MCLGRGLMAVIGVDFSGKFPDAPPCYCVAVKDDRVSCVLMTGKAKRIVRRHRIRKELATATHIYFAVKPLAGKNDVILIDAEYDSKYLKRIRLYLQKVLDVSSIAVGHTSNQPLRGRISFLRFLGK